MKIKPLKAAIAVLLLSLFAYSIKSVVVAAQKDSAQTEVPGAGPCSNFPKRFQTLHERLAWFYGCMHMDPPNPAQIEADIAKLPPERRAPLRGLDAINREVLFGIAFGDLPIQIYPK